MEWTLFFTWTWISSNYDWSFMGQIFIENNGKFQSIKLYRMATNHYSSIYWNLGYKKSYPE